MRTNQNFVHKLIARIHNLWAQKIARLTQTWHIWVLRCELWECLCVCMLGQGSDTWFNNESNVDIMRSIILIEISRIDFSI